MKRKMRLGRKNNEREEATKKKVEKKKDYKDEVEEKGWKASRNAVYR